MNFKDFSNYCSNTRALIIGDIMLDRYVIGDVNRISPEAPVPIIDINLCEDNLAALLMLQKIFQILEWKLL